MDFVDEKQRAASGLAAGTGAIEGLLEVGDAGKNRRKLLEMEVGFLRQKTRYGGLAGSRRPSEDHRAKRAGGEHAGQRPVRPEKMVLADDVGEPFRPEPVGERSWRRFFQPRRLEERRHRFLTR
jgi:hypothetical protein